MLTQVHRKSRFYHVLKRKAKNRPSFRTKMDFNIKTSTFSGLKKDWGRWSITFLAKGKLRGYKELLLGIEIAPVKGSKSHEEFMIKNDLAFAELLIASECDICLGIVDSSRSESMPEGDACLAWRNLVAKFEPVTKANLIKMKREFAER